MLTDSHCHLDLIDLAEYNNDLNLLLLEARRVGVENFLCPAVTLDNCPKILQIAKKYSNIVVTAGLHPSEQLDYELKAGELCLLADDPLVVGIGETGLDYYYGNDEPAREKQRQRFITHIHAAKELNKPLVIHSREAVADIIKILRQENAGIVGGVMHCYTESWEAAQELLAMGFYISVSGIVTFKSADLLRSVARQLPLDRLLFETDAPYLAPVPYRGKQNEPKYIPIIAEFVAKLRNEQYLVMAQQTTENFLQLFGLP
jgi:TatD DNase family protein